MFSRIMAGSSIHDDGEFASSNGARTLVLVGRTGNGKSATANSILKKKAFFSKASSAGVTKTCEMKSTVLKDGQILNVIDTPGLFDFSADIEFIGKEIAKCINMAKDGIHAFLFILSIGGRFSKEEEAAVNSLRTLFGNKITDYMIVVFTGGDQLEDDETLEDYLSRDCPQPLKEVLRLCENRLVLFDNRTRDQKKKDEQVRELLSHVNLILAKTDGKPYTNELFEEFKKGAMKLHDQTKDGNSREKLTKEDIVALIQQMNRASEEQLKRVTEMVELRLRETISRLEKEVAEERAARLNTEKIANDAQKKSNDEINDMRKSLNEAKKKPKDDEASEGWDCAIL